MAKAKKKAAPETVREKKIETFAELAIGLVKLWFGGTRYIVRESDAAEFCKRKACEIAKGK